jgi:hypothetical protein
MSRILQIIVVISFVYANANVDVLERDALYSLFNSTHGYSWKWNDTSRIWNFSEISNPCCDNALYTLN